MLLSLLITVGLLMLLAASSLTVIERLDDDQAQQAGLVGLDQRPSTPEPLTSEA
ncbi:hypothetical protein [Deinococcus yunweiensis]|uniref:hypothetical protein n=1 Tax=Deinococcus yunweiensis TaxID=367282 RepID=UPI00398E9AA6